MKTETLADQQARITTIEFNRGTQTFEIIANADRDRVGAFTDVHEAAAFASGFDAGAAWSRRRA